LDSCCRCRDASTGCSYPIRTIDAGDGDGGFSVSCRIEDRADDVRAIYFSAFRGSEYGIEITNAGIRNNTIIEGCNLRVKEDDGDFQGECGAQAPSVLQPCEIQMPRISGSTVTAAFRCEGLISPQRGADFPRELTPRDTSMTAFATLTVTGCD
jgi:hypothetical protein